mmetsp:Transcript_33920/g.81341  ORF Transcript_33920/g.81341 Transcript_33920/m.81341 type:complete len:224 (+) Transcript_33920:141-812(+)
METVSQAAQDSYLARPLPVVRLRCALREPTLAGGIVGPHLWRAADGPEGKDVAEAAVHVQPVRVAAQLPDLAGGVPKVGRARLVDKAAAALRAQNLREVPFAAESALRSLSVCLAALQSLVAPRLPVVGRQRLILEVADPVVGHLGVVWAGHGEVGRAAAEAALRVDAVGPAAQRFHQAALIPEVGDPRLVDEAAPLASRFCCEPGRRQQRQALHAGSQAIQL